jgi:hypothetical protein
VILWKWSLVITALFVTYLMWECGSGLYQGSRLADGAIKHFHRELNDAEYEQICQEADPRFSSGNTHDELIKFLRGVHTKLGNETAGSLGNLQVSANTNGTFIVTSYSSTFDAGKADETFTSARKGSVLRLVNYNIQSNAFVTQ